MILHSWALINIDDSYSKFFTEIIYSPQVFREYITVDSILGRIYKFYTLKVIFDFLKCDKGPKELLVLSNHSTVGICNYSRFKESALSC
jgi:hypothetical protein